MSINIKNKELIKILHHGLSLIDKNKCDGLYPLLETDSVYANNFSKVIGKTFNVNSFAEIDEIAGFFAEIYHHWAPHNATDWIKGFDANFYLNVVDCYCIVPLDTPVIFSPNAEIKRTRHLLDFSIIPVFKTLPALKRYLSNQIPEFQCTTELLDHFVRKSKNALLSRNLVLIKTKGTRENIKRNVNKYLKAFRIIAELVAGYQQIYRQLGSFTESNFTLEYRPKYKEFQYNWVLEFSSLKFELTEALIGKLNNTHSNFIYTFLKSNEGNKGLRNRVLTGLEFYSKGYRSKTDLDKFISYMIALEALFSRDKFTPIRTTLADYIALLYPVSQRLQVHKNVKDLYDLRSSLFHAGQGTITDKNLKELEKLLIRSIFSLFELIRKNQVLTEEGLFNLLLHKKLSVPAVNNK